MSKDTELYSQIGLALSYVLQNCVDLSDGQANAISRVYPEWHVDVDYKAKQVCRYNGDLYRCAQDHKSSEENNTSVASLWTKVTIDQGTGYDVWQQPTGAHNAYNVGDRVLYPDERGNVYESVVNGNTWSPDAYPAGWKLIEE